MIEKGADVHHQWVSFGKISPHLKRAVVIAEDGSFYQHQGIDWHEFQESLKKNLRHRRFSRGFSTISMQLARNLYLSREKKIGRKILEIFIALKMERDLSKERILELYLNLIEWGPDIYGAAEASNYYFQKPAVGLSPEESVFLTAIIPNPVRLGKWPPKPYIRRRMSLLLAKMGYVPAAPLDELETPSEKIDEEEIQEEVEEN